MTDTNAHIEVRRIRDNGIQTIGRATATNGRQSLDFVTVEPSWILNQQHISCIDIGDYTTEKRTSPKEGNHFHLLDVPDRSMILMHVGNFRKNSEGCILVGAHFELLNSDMMVDVAASRATMSRLQALMPEHFEVTITEHRSFSACIFAIMICIMRIPI
jgi:hypothetical protein